MSREFLQYAYSAYAVAHSYRNLGYAYVEKQNYEVAIALFFYSLAYDPSNTMVNGELEYISKLSGKEIVEPTNEEADKLLEQENIQIGASHDILEKLYSLAYLASYSERDEEKTKYYCDLIYGLTHDEDTPKKLLDIAKGSFSIVTNFPQNDEPSYYDQCVERSMKEVFPDYPDIMDCRMRITFTIRSPKYEQTVRQILTHIDDISKNVVDKDVNLYFANLDLVVNSLWYIHDLFSVAHSWTSFKITINDVPRKAEDYRYFEDYLTQHHAAKVRQWTNIDELRKEYKREYAPRTVRKETPEESAHVDLSGCTPQEILTGIAMTYASVYLMDCDVKSYQLSEDEIVLCANDEFVVDFWVSPYGYAETVNGVKSDFAPYEYCTYILQELTKNNLFKYNAAGFRRCFTGETIHLMSERFDGLNHMNSRISRFRQVNDALPELKLMEKLDAWTGDKYCFVVFEMDNADGSVGTGIGCTKKDERSLVLKICKELETKNARTIENNGVNGLEFRLSDTFVTAFNSWKGEKKTQRLENHLRYYSFEEIIKDSGGEYSVLCRIENERAVGKHNDIERKTYADIGRRTKK